ncbi:MAG: hypothetical protein WCJ30_10380 [Deltaproteobacteria bacterium]
MQLIDRIEKRRFVGREFLLWLWFESEIFDATLTTRQHGTFGFWVEKQFVVSESKEITRIKGTQPAAGREAKESLRRGKLPEVAGWHLSIRDQESSFVLKAESLAIGSLKLPTVLGGEEDEPAPLLDRPPQRKKKKAGPLLDEGDVQREVFEERMKLTREFESLIEALYSDFLTLRLGTAWKLTVVPALKTWAGGEHVDMSAYRKARSKALAKKPG